MGRLPPPNDLLFLLLKACPKELFYPLDSIPEEREFALAGDGVVI